MDTGNSTGTKRLPSMVGWLKTALGVALLGGTAIVLVAFAVNLDVLIFDAAEDQKPLDTVNQIAFWVAGVAGLITWVGLVFALVWVIRNYEGRRQWLWGLGLVFIGLPVACVWWWKVARPLPEPGHAPS